MLHIEAESFCSSICASYYSWSKVRFSLYGNQYCFSYTILPFGPVFSYTLWDYLSKILIRCLDLPCQEVAQIFTCYMIHLFQSYQFFYSCRYMPILIVSCWRHAFVLVSHCLKLLFWCYLAGIITIHIFQLTILPWMVHYRYLQAEYNVHSNLLILHDLPFYMTLLCLPFDVLEQPAVGADGRKVEAQGNVLLASIENMQYAVTVDVLHTVSQIGETLQEYASKFCCCLLYSF